MRIAANNLQNTTLQWDRAGEGAEMQGPSGKSVAPQMLQWDRAGEGAEIV